MPLDLEELLKNYCESGYLDLHKRLDRVRVAARENWERPNLTWYTDHGCEHSRRIIDLLGQIVEHLQETKKCLSPQELYILLAACYLHDIGMQATAIDGRGMEDFGPSDYELIRQRHPQRAYELIIECTVRPGRDHLNTGLNDKDTYYKCIALVSKGHGTDFFKETLEEFAQKRYSPGGKQIRGDLLTALLLMADELDLSVERARFPSEMDLSAISSIHHHLHHYVINVQVIKGEHSKQRRIRLDLEFPKDSTQYKPKIRKWLVSKLQRQCRLTAPIIRQATDGELDWCEQIEVCETFDATGVAQRDLPLQALSQLERQISDYDTVNYDEIVDILKKNVLRSQAFYAVCLNSQDEEAKVTVINWLLAHCASQMIPTLLFDLRHSADMPKDIPIRLYRRLMALQLPSDGSESQRKRVAQYNPSKSPDNLNKMIAKDLRQFAKRGHVVLVFQNVDCAEPQTTHWLAGDFLSNLREGNPPISVILTLSKPLASVEDGPGNYESLQLGDLSEQAIALHCQRAFGYHEQEATKLAQSAYAATMGKPTNVISWFAYMRQQESKLIS